MAGPAANVEAFLRQRFDYLIIGGGTAGLVVAARLSEDANLTIGVLESGPVIDKLENVDIPGLYGQAIGTDLDWQFETTSQEGLGGRTLPWPRGKMLGGTSALNFMTWNRASRDDYDDWVQLGNNGWGWDDLLPFLKRSEAFHPPGPEMQHTNKEYYDDEAFGMNGPVHISYSKAYSDSHQVWHQTLNNLGVDTNRRHMAGSNVGVWTNINSVNPRSYERSYSSTAYYLPYSQRPNLHVLTGVLVNEILLKQQHGDWVAHGVRFAHDGKQYAVQALREVVLSAGSVQSPQLLELSGIGNPEILGSAGIETKVSNANVGENLQDHITMIFEVNSSLANPDDLKTNDNAKAAAMRQYTQSQSGPLTVLPCSICYLPLSHFVPEDILSSLQSRTADLNNIAQNKRKILAQRFDSQKSLGQIEYIFDLGNWNPYFEPAAGKKYGTMLQILQYPFSRGSIHIRSSDAADKPIIDPAYYSGPGGQMDLEAMVLCARFADRICRTAPLARIVGARASPPASATRDEDLRGWTVENTITDYHPVGTCAMGGFAGAEQGVVDERLRVYGVGRLRVVDASIMPLQISAHLQATVYAIAEKGACMILEDRLERRPHM
ncbi:putative choline dehydrogenase [Truncatella angustata]|uniref:Choline dehydrogenase n=1 Tax=Truncatella angustata TaxID=152316 RepID=A0A9P8UNG8_9PEZI|nr:putative choline dehydrogenase [Truncatella angustata]KAH6655332.1 putative choline dehydrogenase [Truncatella angustata]